MRVHLKGSQRMIMNKK